MVAQSKNKLLPTTQLAALLAQTMADPYQTPKTGPGFLEHARFGTASRLLTCLTNEQLVDALYVADDVDASLSFALIAPCNSKPEELMARSIVCQLRHKPVLAGKADTEMANVSRISFLDPEDLGLGMWTADQGSGEFRRLVEPDEIMRMVGKWSSFETEAIDNICRELASSVENQAYAFEHRKPSPDILQSTAIEWEQSIVEGHATHPMHRARYAVAPLEPIAPSTDLFHLRLAFVAVPRSQLNVEGDFEKLLAPLYSAADSDDGKNQYILDFTDQATELVMPVHPMHLPAVKSMFEFVRVLPFSAPAEAQASLRTVCPTAFTPLGYDIKLPLGIKVSSALRTISPWSTFVGPRITDVIPKILDGAPVQDALLISGEPASAVSNNQDFDIAKYLSCVIRDDPEYICRPRGERVILAAALTNFNAQGVSMAVEQWSLDTVDKRRAFLRSYVSKLFDAFLPSIMNHGFAFESHPQNSLLRIDAVTGDIKGFIARDFGGIKVHRETFRKSTGVDIDMLPDACTDAPVMYEVYDLAYHTLIQCQTHRLVRALELHYQGNGWAVVREEFEKRVPEHHPLRDTWYQDSFDLKCFITMKLDGLYRDYVYKKVPNVLFYKNEAEGVVFPQ